MNVSKVKVASVISALLIGCVIIWNASHSMDFNYLLWFISLTLSLLIGFTVLDAPGEYSGLLGLFMFLIVSYIIGYLLYPLSRCDEKIFLSVLVTVSNVSVFATGVCIGTKILEKAKRV